MSEQLIQVDSIKFLSELESASSISKKFEIFNKVLNQQPLVVKNMNEQLKKNGGFGSKATDYDYIPIGVVEQGLRQIFFNQVDFIIKSNFRDLNTFVVVASIRYKCPVSLELREIDGIGAKSIQQDKGASIGEFNSTMKQNGLELSVGTAYSRAIKNAAAKLGEVFGQGLNRDDEGELHFYNKRALN